jgi:hypothetical protein
MTNDIKVSRKPGRSEVAAIAARSYLSLVAEGIGERSLNVPVMRPFTLR